MSSIITHCILYIIFNFIDFEKRTTPVKESIQFENYEVEKENKTYSPSITFQIKSNAESLSTFKKPTAPKTQRIILLPTPEITVATEMSTFTVPTSLPSIKLNENFKITSDNLEFSNKKTIKGILKENARFFNNSKLKNLAFKEKFGFNLDKDEILICVDLSGSLSSNREEVIKSLLIAIEAHSSGKRIKILGFAGEVKYISGNWINNKQMNISEILYTIKRTELNIAGGSLAVPIIKKGNSIRPKQTIIITDGNMQDMSEWHKALNTRKGENLGEICVVYLGNKNTNFIPHNLKG